MARVDNILTPEQRAAGLSLKDHEDRLTLFLNGKEVAVWGYPWTRLDNPRYASVSEIRQTADKILAKR